MSRVLVLEFDTERLDILCEGLQRGGHDVVSPQARVSDLARLVGEWEPDVVIIDTDSPDRDTLEHVLTLTRTSPRPVLMFSADPDGAKIREAIRAGVSAYVVNGLEAARVQPIVDAAIARFNELQALREELEEARTANAERKVVERAKGLLMKSHAAHPGDGDVATHRRCRSRGPRSRTAAHRRPGAALSRAGALAGLCALQ